MKLRYLFPLVLLLTGLRLAWVLAHEIAPSEAYFWMCARHLAGGYFDGPAGTALVVRAFGESFEMARLFWPVLGFFCSATAWLLVRKLYDASVAGWAVALLNVLPAFNLAAVAVGPLMPALASVFAGLVFARVAWDGRRLAWLGAGLFFAVALLFRYEAVLVPLGVIAGMLSLEQRRTPGNLLGLAFVVLLCGLALLPALRWNAALEWIPIAGGTWRTAWEFRWMPFFASLRGFSAAVSLGVFVAIPFALVALIRGTRSHGRTAFVLASCGAAWGWAAYMLLRGEDAVAAGMFGFLPLAAFALSAIQKQAWAVPLGSLAGLVAVLTTGWMFWGEGRVSWAAVAGELHNAARDLPASDAGGGFFIAEDADQAAVLGYFLRGGEGKYPPVFVSESPAITSQFAFWPSYADFVESDQVANEYFLEQKGINPFLGRNAIYLGGDLPQTIKAAFQAVKPLRKIPLADGRELTVFLCLGYQTLPL